MLVHEHGPCQPLAQGWQHRAEMPLMHGQEDSFGTLSICLGRNNVSLAPAVHLHAFAESFLFKDL